MTRAGTFGRRTPSPLALLSALAVALPLLARGAAAQSPACTEQETVLACYERAVQEAAQKRADESLETAKQKVEGKPAGTEARVVPNEVALRNFVTRLSAAAAMPGLVDDPAALGLRLNLPLNDGVFLRLPFTLQFESTVARPTPYKLLLDSVPEASRPAVEKRLTDSLRSFDDVTLRIALNLENRSFGRNVAQHRDEIGVWTLSTLGPAADRLLAAGDAALAAIAAAPLDPAPTCAPASPNTLLRCFTPESRTQVVAALGRAAEASVAANVEFRALTQRSGLSLLGSLIDNQPQLNLTVSHRAARELVGPRLTTITGRWEFGLANLNGLRAYCERRTRSARANGTAIPSPADCLRGYTQAPVRQSLARGDRIFVAVEGTVQSPYDIALADPAVRVTFGEQWSTTARAGYGAYLGTDTNSVSRARVDVEGGYTAEAKDSPRKSRWFAGLTFTQRFTDASSSVLSLTYQSDPSYLQKSDTRLRANLGFSYKVLTSAKQ